MWLYFALLSATIFGFQSLISKKILQKEHSVEYLSLLYTFGFIVQLPFLNSISRVGVRELFSILIRTIFMAISMIYYIKSLKHMKISAIAPLANVVPLFSLLLGILFLDESLAFVQIAGVFTIIIGSYILTTQGHIKNWHKPLNDLIRSKYFHYGLLYAFFRALTFLISKMIINSGLDSNTIMFYHYLFSASIFMMVTFFVYNGIEDIKEGLKLGGGTIFIIAVLGLLGSFCTLLAMEDPTSKISLIVPITQLSSLISVFVGSIIFHEDHKASSIISTVLMIFGVFLILAL